jgi:sugar/nucleoside kinase (ribokinase family)
MDHTKVLLFGQTDAPASLLDGADVVFFNGYDIFLAGSTGFLSPILADARRRGIPIAFDPSSFTLIDRYGAARLRHELGPLDILIANDAEAASLGGTAALASWAGLVVVKRGPEGASAYRGDTHWTAPPQPIAAVDTTGAGDGFDAAFLVEWLATRDVSRALEQGNRLGAYVASHLGAQPAAPAAMGSEPIAG